MAAKSTRSHGEPEPGSGVPAIGLRSPIGQLVHSHRTRLHLTQLELAVRASHYQREDLKAATVSERTVTAIEKFAVAGEIWNRPRRSTVRALAAAIGLAPGSDAYAEFLAAAALTSELPRPEQHAVTEEAMTISPATPGFIPQGRQPHLDRLAREVAHVVTGRPGVVMVCAPPGVGKSTLIAESCRLASIAHPQLAVLWGECSGHLGTPDAWQPFRQAAGVMLGDIAAANAYQRVSNHNVAELERRAPEALRLLIEDGPDLINRLVPGSVAASLIERPSTPPELGERLRDLIASPREAPENANAQIEQLLLGYAKQGPTILVLDDLQWAEQFTTNLLFQLIRQIRLAQVPLLIIGSYRTSELDVHHEADHRSMTSIVNELPRFFPEPILDLSTAVGGSAGQAFVDAFVTRNMARASDQIRDSLFAQTGGLPLFVQSMLRWYEARGAIAYDQEGNATLVAKHLPRELPTEIDAVFSALVSRLSPGVQDLLEAASVQGDTFSAEIVMDVCRLDMADLLDLLDGELDFQHQIVKGGGRLVVAGTVSHTYRFAHVLLRDYIYHRLSDLRRHHLHAATARAMRMRYGSDAHEASSLIARHDEAAGDYDQAALSWVRAGDHSLLLLDLVTADLAFAHVATLPRTRSALWAHAQALVGRGNCARGMGDRIAAARFHEEAHSLASIDNLRSVMANSLTSLAMLDYDAGRMREGSSRLRQAAEMLFEIGDRIEAARSLALLSHTLAGIGEFDEAIESAKRSVDTLTELDERTVLLTARIAFANCQFEIGHYQWAITLYRQCVLAARLQESTHREAVSLMNMLQSQLELGLLDDARATLTEIDAIRDRINHRLMGSILFEQGLLEELTGNWDSAERLYEQSATSREAYAQTGQWIDSLAGLLRVAMARGDTRSTSQLVKRIRSMIASRGLEGVEYVGRVYVTLASAAQHLGHEHETRAIVIEGNALIASRSLSLSDPEDRRAYLECIPSHRQLRELAIDAAGSRQP